jgi:hypothetical protein
MSNAIARLTTLLGKIGVDQAVPGLRELFAALSEERARRFVGWLSEDDEEKSVDAATAMTRLVQAKDGEKILRHVVREIFWGTETVSLAGLALLASRAGRHPEDSFFARAARAIDGLSNADAAVFLFLMSNPLGVSVHQEWRPACFFPLSTIQSETWAPVRTVLGVDEEQMVTGISELVQRRIFLPDASSGRLGGEEVTIFFGFSRDSLRFYELLHRSFELAEPVIQQGLGLFRPPEVDILWRGRLTSS